MNKLILLTSVAVFSFGMLSESRADIIASGDDCAAEGSTCHWEIDSDGKLTITGSGAMKENFGNTKRQDNPKAYDGYTTAASWGNYHSSITSIEIGEGITDTGDRAFQGLSNVQSVTIPKSLETVGRNAFDRMPNMNSFSVPDGSKLTSVSSGAFQFSSSLNTEYAQKILDTVGYNNKINGTTFEIPDNTFYKGGLTGEITIPEGVTSIGNYAFQNASSLKSITIPEGVTSIGNWAFAGASSLTSITIPDSVTSIGYAAFTNASSLKSITIPDSVTSIGNFAFEGATGLENIIIPDNIDTKNWNLYAFGYFPQKTNIVCQGDLNTCYEKLAKYLTNCPQNLIDAGISCNCSSSWYCIDSGLVTEATKDQCGGKYIWNENSTPKCRHMDKEECAKSAKYYINSDEQCKSMPGSKTKCKNADFLWSGSSCVKSCASGFVEWDKECLSEYPFAKKRWTPAEANQWLHDGNDNFVVITFKK